MGFLAVVGDCTWIGRVGDQQATGIGALAVRLHRREARADRRRAAQRKGPRQRARQGVVAAGVKDDDAHGRIRRERGEHRLDRNRARLKLRRLLQFGIHGNEVVAPVHLQAVTGIEDQRDVGVVGGLRELVEKLGHPCFVQIRSLDHRETGAAQRVCDKLAVGGRVWKGDGMGIGAVAYHQRNTLAFDVGAGVAERERGKDKYGDCA